jgi:hypothetical protein
MVHLLGDLACGPETLVLYRTRPTVSAPGRLGISCGARPIQPFEGSRPWGSVYANSMGLGLGERFREQVLEQQKAEAGLVWL